MRHSHELNESAKKESNWLPRTQDGALRCTRNFQPWNVKSTRANCNLPRPQRAGEIRFIENCVRTHICNMYAPALLQLLDFAGIAVHSIKERGVRCGPLRSQSLCTERQTTSHTRSPCCSNNNLSVMAGTSTRPRQVLFGIWLRHLHLQ